MDIVKSRWYWSRHEGSKAMATLISSSERGTGRMPKTRFCTATSATINSKIYRCSTELLINISIANIITTTTNNHYHQQQHCQHQWQHRYPFQISPPATTTSTGGHTVSPFDQWRHPWVCRRPIWKIKCTREGADCFCREAWSRSSPCRHHGHAVEVTIPANNMYLLQWDVLEFSEKFHAATEWGRTVKNAPRAICTYKYTGGCLVHGWG
jgi:hypothetical protein